MSLMEELPLPPGPELALASLTVNVIFLLKPIRHFNDGWDEYRSSLSTMVSMMFNQASGRPSANHGLFPKYGIEAVTLKGRKNVGTGSVSFGRLGRYGILMSIL
jgi:glycosylphosphatidylinositol transamidase